MPLLPELGDLWDDVAINMALLTELGPAATQQQVPLIVCTQMEAVSTQVPASFVRDGWPCEGAGERGRDCRGELRAFARRG